MKLRINGAHFISGKKNNDTVSPDYVPLIFGHVSSPVRKGEMKMTAYKRRKESLKRCLGLLTSTPIALQVSPVTNLLTVAISVMQLQLLRG